MTRDEAVSWVQFHLGSRTDLTTQAQNALNAAQEELERRDFLPWFLRTEVATTTTASSEERLAVPSDFIREWEEGALYRIADNEELIPLEKNTLTVLRAQFRGTAIGAPTDYALDNDYFRLFPTPDAAYDVKMIYYAHDAVLATNVENRWLKNAPWMMIAEAIMILAPGLRDTAAYTLAEKKSLSAKSDVIRAGETRDIENRRLQMGGPL